MGNKKSLCNCLLGFFDDDTAIIDFDYSKRLFVLLVGCRSPQSHFVLVKLISDEPCALYGYSKDVDYYPVQIAEVGRCDFDKLHKAYKALCSADYIF